MVISGGAGWVVGCVALCMMSASGVVSFGTIWVFMGLSAVVWAGCNLAGALCWSDGIWVSCHLFDILGLMIYVLHDLEGSFG